MRSTRSAATISRIAVTALVLLVVCLIGCSNRNQDKLPIEAEPVHVLLEDLVGDFTWIVDGFPALKLRFGPVYEEEGWMLVTLLSLTDEDTKQGTAFEVTENVFVCHFHDVEGMSVLMILHAENADALQWITKSALGVEFVGRDFYTAEEDFAVLGRVGSPKSGDPEGE